MDRENILDRAASPEERALIARVLDKIQAVNKFHEVAVTEFYDPYQQGLVTPVLARAPEISFAWSGGYEMAERQRLVLGPDYLEPARLDPEIEILSVSGNLKFQKVTHRDFLGAVLGLGIKREKIGDVVVNPQGCYVIADRSIAGYVMSNLTRVHRVAVKVDRILPDDMVLPEEKVKVVYATVSSLRLDAVAAAGFGVSRSKMAAEIGAEKVKVNWHVVADCSYTVKEGDRISVRGRGRAEIEEIRGETRKGRISLVIRRYI